MFTQPIREFSIVSNSYQIFALKNQIYVYRTRELHDCIKTSSNEKGIYSCATFKGDDLRLIIATLGEKSVCSVQIKDFTFEKDFLIENIFGSN